MTTTTTSPTLSLGLVNRRDDDSRDWSPLFDLARAADRAGIDRLTVSDHVVFGENIDGVRPARSSAAGRAGSSPRDRKDSGWSR